jgi:hypothetical protein
MKFIVFLVNNLVDRCHFCSHIILRDNCIQLEGGVGGVLDKTTYAKHARRFISIVLSTFQETILVIPVLLFSSFRVTRYKHVYESDEGKELRLFLYPLDNLLVCIICFRAQ